MSMSHNHIRPTGVMKSQSQNLRFLCLCLWKSQSDSCDLVLFYCVWVLSLLWYWLCCCSVLIWCVTVMYAAHLCCCTVLLWYSVCVAVIHVVLLCCVAVLWCVDVIYCCVMLCCCTNYARYVDVLCCDVKLMCCDIMLCWCMLCCCVAVLRWYHVCYVVLLCCVVVFQCSAILTSVLCYCYCNVCYVMLCYCAILCCCTMLTGRALPASNLSDVHCEYPYLLWFPGEIPGKVGKFPGNSDFRGNWRCFYRGLYENVLKRHQEMIISEFSSIKIFVFPRGRVFRQWASSRIQKRLNLLTPLHFDCSLVLTLQECFDVLFIYCVDMQRTNTQDTCDGRGCCRVPVLVSFSRSAP